MCSECRGWELLMTWTPTMFLHSTESLTGKTHGRSWVLWSTRQVTSLPLSAGVGTRRYSLRTVTVPSGPLTAMVEWFPPTDASHLMVAAGFPSAASHRATTTDLELAWTVTTLAEFFGLAKGAEGQIWKTERWWKLEVTERRKLKIGSRGKMIFLKKWENWRDSKEKHKE